MHPCMTVTVEIVALCAISLGERPGQKEVKVHSGAGNRRIARFGTQSGWRVRPAMEQWK